MNSRLILTTCRCISCNLVAFYFSGCQQSSSQILITIPISTSVGEDCLLADSARRLKKMFILPESNLERLIFLNSLLVRFKQIKHSFLPRQKILYKYSYFEWVWKQSYKPERGNSEYCWPGIVLICKQIKMRNVGFQEQKSYCAGTDWPSLSDDNKSLKSPIFLKSYLFVRCCQIWELESCKSTATSCLQVQPVARLSM